jgi:hypothetical protein
MKHALFVSVLVIWCMLMTERAAYAYMDPGNGSLFLQLVLGGAAGVGLLFKLYWRKFLEVIGLRARDAEAEHRQRT